MGEANRNFAKCFYWSDDKLLEQKYKPLKMTKAEMSREIRMYRKLEEQGLLLKLPCKVGDIVYMIINQRDNYDDTIYQIVSATSFGLSMIDNIGKTVFLTREEAEKKLKEMESD